MSKQKVLKDNSQNSTRLSELVVQAGALGFAALTLIGASEMIMKQVSALNPAAGHGSTALNEMFARGEGKNESARMPEEFDIGMQTPRIAGV